MAGSLLLVLSSFAVLCDLGHPARAADTPCLADGPEEGGTRTCFDAGKNGHVYVWKPDKYDPATAITVVHIHGYSVFDEDGSSNHYVDEAWTNHGLARKFRMSGLNALFIVPEAFTNVGAGRHWSTLDGLLRQVESHASTVPSNVVVEYHSSGVFTVGQDGWIGDQRITQLIMLDAFYGRLRKFTAWAKGGNGRKITLCNSSDTGTNERLRALTRGLPDIVRHTGIPARLDDLPEAKKNAEVLFFDLASELDHMEVVRTDKVIPVLLQRAACGQGRLLLGCTRHFRRAGGSSHDTFLDHRRQKRPRQGHRHRIVRPKHRSHRR